MVSKVPAGRPSVSCAGRVWSTTRSASSGCPVTWAASRSIAVAEKSVAQYVSQCGAICESSRPVPQPISSTRRGSRARIRATVASRHSRICSTGIGLAS